MTEQPAPGGDGRTAATDSEVDPDRVAALLGDAGLAWLVDRCARRLRWGRALTGTVTKQHATDDERAAVTRLLGRAPRRGASLTVALDDVEAALLRAGAAPSLAAAVEALRGDVTGQAAATTARQQAWQDVLEQAQAWAADQPWQARWLERLRADGLLVRLTGGDPDAAADLLATCRRVFAALPAGGRSRSVLAADVTGDGHALDDGTALATLVLRGAAELAGRATGPDGGGRATADAASRRELWAAVGVTVDPLASQVAVLNLPVATTSATGAALAALAAAGEPAVLTLRQVVGESIAFDVAGTTVSVCENPSVLGAAADRLGTASAPVVCLDGHPSTAAQLLLDQLVAAGARVRVRADFDWAGLRIAGAALARTGGRPWRLRAADYEAAAPRSAKALVGTPAATPWDPALAAALRARDVAVEEELMLDELLADLASR